LEQAVPTATRSGEVCELAGPRSTSIRSCESIPADRMKSTKEHRVPLLKQAIQLLGLPD
jgi:integrase